VRPSHPLQQQHIQREERYRCTAVRPGFNHEAAQQSSRERVTAYHSASTQPRLKKKPTPFASESNFLYLRPHFGGIAQLARALAWHARGHRFESDYLHRINPEAFVDQRFRDFCLWIKATSRPQFVVYDSVESENSFLKSINQFPLLSGVLKSSVRFFAKIL
jgi:hypothetical protein